MSSNTSPIQSRSGSFSAADITSSSEYSLTGAISALSECKSSESNPSGQAAAASSSSMRAHFHRSHWTCATTANHHSAGSASPTQQDPKLAALLDKRKDRSAGEESGGEFSAKDVPNAVQLIKRISASLLDSSLEPELEALAVTLDIHTQIAARSKPLPPPPIDPVAVQIDAQEGQRLSKLQNSAEQILSLIDRCWIRRAWKLSVIDLVNPTVKANVDGSEKMKRLSFALDNQKELIESSSVLLQQIVSVLVNIIDMISLIKNGTEEDARIARQGIDEIDAESTIKRCQQRFDESLLPTILTEFPTDETPGQPRAAPGFLKRLTVKASGAFKKEVDDQLLKEALEGSSTLFKQEIARLLSEACGDLPYSVGQKVVVVPRPMLTLDAEARFPSGVTYAVVDSINCDTMAALVTFPKSEGQSFVNGSYPLGMLRPYREPEA